MTTITEEMVDSALETLDYARRGTRGPIPKQAMEKALRAALSKLPPAPDREAHKVMTAEEYLAANIKGWHETCWNVDGFGGVGVRCLGSAAPDRNAVIEECAKAARRRM